MYTACSDFEREELLIMASCINGSKIPDNMGLKSALRLAVEADDEADEASNTRDISFYKKRLIFKKNPQSCILITNCEI